MGNRHLVKLFEHAFGNAGNDGTGAGKFLTNALDLAFVHLLEHFGGDFRAEGDEENGALFCAGEIDLERGFFGDDVANFLRDGYCSHGFSHIVISPFRREASYAESGQL